MGQVELKVTDTNGHITQAGLPQAVFAQLQVILPRLGQMARLHQRTAARFLDLDSGRDGQIFHV